MTPHMSLFYTPTDYEASYPGRTDFFFVVEASNDLLQLNCGHGISKCPRLLWPMECDPNREDLHEPLEAAFCIGSIHEVLIRDGTYLKLEFDGLTDDGKALYRQMEDLYGKGRVRIEAAIDLCEDCRTNENPT